MKGFYLLLFVVFFSCGQQPQNEVTADLVLLNGNLVTMDETLPKAAAIAIKDSRILAIGKQEEIQAFIDEKSTKVIDLEGKTAVPGFIEGHGHFSNLGYSLIQLNLLKTKNWEEILAMVDKKVKESKPGEWIVGRGWHQEKWDKPVENAVHGYPVHKILSELSPDNPVLLGHASGHSAFANAKAMQAAGITRETPEPKGGHIVRDANGDATGVFEERAVDPVLAAYAEYQKTLSQEKLTAEWHRAIEMAEQNCLENGVTSFQDAGSTYIEIDRYKALAEKDELDVRLWAMIRQPYEETKVRIAEFPLLNVGKNAFTVRAIKSQVDGALGAHGAWLLEPYEDKPGFYGQNTTEVSEVENMADLCIKHGLQLCVHAIGDRANREVLDIYEKTFNTAEQEDLRWRIEHAQHVNVEDIPRFAELDVIASMQGIHCTSDAPFVEKRLGERRAKEESYAWRSFLDQGVKIANGTDVPVEVISVIENYYASVTRKRQDGQSFFTDQRMTREEALRSYTIDNAFAAFEEKDKGSLTKGKLADITVLSKDILSVPDEELLTTEVLYTIVGGEVKFRKK